MVLMDNNIIDRSERALGALKEKGVKPFLDQVNVSLNCSHEQGTNTPSSYFYFMEKRGFSGLSMSTTCEVLPRQGCPDANNEPDSLVIGKSNTIGSKPLNSMDKEESLIKNTCLANSVHGYFVTFESKVADLNIGGLNTISQS